MDTQRKQRHRLAKEVETMGPEAGAVFLASKVGHLEDRVGELRDEQQALGATIAEEGRLTRQVLQDFGDRLIAVLKPVAWVVGTGLVLGFLVVAGGGLAILGVGLDVAMDREQVQVQTTPSP